MDVDDAGHDDEAGDGPVPGAGDGFAGGQDGGDGAVAEGDVDGLDALARQDRAAAAQDGGGHADSCALMPRRGGQAGFGGHDLGVFRGHVEQVDGVGGGAAVIDGVMRDDGAEVVGEGVDDGAADAAAGGAAGDDEGVGAKVDEVAGEGGSEEGAGGVFWGAGMSRPWGAISATKS